VFPTLYAKLMPTGFQKKTIIKIVTYKEVISITLYVHENIGRAMWKSLPTRTGFRGDFCRINKILTKIAAASLSGTPEIMFMKIANTGTVRTLPVGSIMEPRSAVVRRQTAFPV
jgi:hypothetical protein